jgi:hypothetical protein
MIAAPSGWSGRTACRPKLSHECLRLIQLAGDQTRRSGGRESDAGGFRVAFRNVAFSIRDLELVRMAAAGRDDLE